MSTTTRNKTVINGNSVWKITCTKSTLFWVEWYIMSVVFFFFFQNIGGGKCDLRPDLWTSPLAAKIAFRTWIRLASWQYFIRQKLYSKKLTFESAKSRWSECHRVKCFKRNSPRHILREVVSRLLLKQLWTKFACLMKYWSCARFKPYLHFYWNSFSWN